MPAILGQSLQARSPIHVTRDDDGDTGNTSLINLLIIILAVLVGLGLVLLGALMVLKRIRRNRQQAASPPCYNDVVHENKNLHHLTIETKESRSSVIVYKDGRPMLANPNSPPHSPDNVPEIHITFPDEEDHSGGKRKSGRVVVVRVGDNAAVGLEPLDEDQLPAYEKAGSFYSIDMDDIGGLKEKSHEDYH